MKWQNKVAEGGYYYITGTVTEWLPLLSRDDIRRAVCYEIKIALNRFGATVVAYVIMPTHLHLLVHLPNESDLHRFCKCWRGRSARRIIDMLLRQNEAEELAVLARHANGDCRYAAWKEQARVLGIVTEKKLRQMINYIHANPVRRGLVSVPGDWPHSSFNWYEQERVGVLPVKAPVI